MRSVNTDGGVNLQFKLLSAIGIIIIVSGHCYHGGMELAYNWFPPYSYNLALFVFISGYFYKTDYEENIGKYIWKRTKRLLIPAYLWNIFYGGMVAFLGLFGFTIGAKPDLYNLFGFFVNSWGNPKNEIKIFNKRQKIKLSLVFLIDRQTYVKYDCENA